MTNDTKKYDVDALRIKINALLDTIEYVKNIPGVLFDSELIKVKDKLKLIAKSYFEIEGYENKKRTASPLNKLITAFEWSDTPEGFNYWKDAYDLLNLYADHMSISSTGGSSTEATTPRYVAEMWTSYINSRWANWAANVPPELTAQDVENMLSIKDMVDV